MGIIGTRGDAVEVMVQSRRPAPLRPVRPDACAEVATFHAQHPGSESLGERCRAEKRVEEKAVPSLVIRLQRIAQSSGGI